MQQSQINPDFASPIRFLLIVNKMTQRLEERMSDDGFEICLRPGLLSTSTVISVKGRIVVENLPAFRQSWQSVQTDVVVVDLSAVSYLDSSGIGSLVNAHVACINRGKKLAIAGAPDRVRRLMSLTQVDRVLRLYADTVAAEMNV